jgi:hypothetical protein
VLGAYFHAEHMRVFRRLLWRRLAIFGVVCLVVAASTSWISPKQFVGVIAALGVVGGVAAIAEWRASQKLVELLRSTGLDPNP